MSREFEVGKEAFVANWGYKTGTSSQLAEEHREKLWSGCLFESGD